MSNYLNTIAKLSPQKRFEMMDLGLNPLNPEHIKQYNSGNYKVNMKENVEYIKSVVGYDVNLEKDLGHAAERDTEPPEYRNEHGNIVRNGENNQEQRKQGNNQSNIRKNIMDDMDDMVESVARKSNNMTSKLLDIRQTKNTRPQNNKEQSSDKLQEALKVGRKKSTDFHNSYIRCIQNPSTQAYMEVYKTLKIMLEQEQKLLNSSLLPNYKKGINEVTNNMFKKITNQING